MIACIAELKIPSCGEQDADEAPNCDDVQASVKLSMFNGISNGNGIGVSDFTQTHTHTYPFLYEVCEGGGARSRRAPREQIQRCARSVIASMPPSVPMAGNVYLHYHA